MWPESDSAGDFQSPKSTHHPRDSAGWGEIKVAVIGGQNKVAPEPPPPAFLRDASPGGEAQHSDPNPRLSPFLTSTIGDATSPEVPTLPSGHPSPDAVASMVLSGNGK